MADSGLAAAASPNQDGWRRARHQAPLADVYRSVQIPPRRSMAVADGDSSVRTVNRIAAFIGPGYLVAVGYMDPGNWATAIAGGSRFGYALLWVALLSNVMAILLQSLCARLAIASGRDLAQACHDAYPKSTASFLWILAEIAIIATDVAEVIGTAIGINLLFGLPITIGIVITTLDVFLVLALQRFGFRYIELFVIAMLAVIAVCFGTQIALVHVDWAAAARGLIPSPQIVSDRDMLFLALGILGATVMPHNLYLHSAIVQTRAFGRGKFEKLEALRYTTLDSTIALMLAFLINAALLLLAAASYNRAGHTNVSDLSEAHALLAPLLGSDIAPRLFGIALLCCGLNSTITATMAGQIVMEGFVNWRIAPWMRRLVTRAIAVVPAGMVSILYGTGSTSNLLLASQVILALQLPFAVIPLIHLTASKRKMGDLAAPRWLTLMASASAFVIVVLGIVYIQDSLRT